MTLVELTCPEHHWALMGERDGTAYYCPRGCRFPITGNIPRFVPPENYAASFGLQWNTFRRTQLDSHTGTTVSRDRLRRIAGGDLEILRGKAVLEAGCGAGRFTEVLLAHGARVFAVDVSLAVEANYASFGDCPGYFVAQADIARLPVADGAFDVVVCVGVIQHTQNPELTITALCRYLRPGGLLLLDHYSPGYPITASRRVLRSFLLKRSPEFALRLCNLLVAVLWPLHRASYLAQGVPGMDRVRQWVLQVSPVVDYHEAYPQLGASLLHEWALLDTHDTLTDRYKHLRSAEEIRAHLVGCGMKLIDVAYAGNGVEARAVRGAG